MRGRTDIKREEEREINGMVEGERWKGRIVTKMGEVMRTRKYGERGEWREGGGAGKRQGEFFV